MDHKIETHYDNVDWDGLVQDVQTKLTYLRLAWRASEHDCEPELHRKIVEELYLPAIRLLAEFCSCIEDDGTGAASLSAILQRGRQPGSPMPSRRK